MRVDEARETLEAEAGRMAQFQAIAHIAAAIRTVLAELDEAMTLIPIMHNEKLDLKERAEEAERTLARAYDHAEAWVIAANEREMDAIHAMALAEVDRDEWRDTARSEMAGRRAAEAEVERLRAALFLRGVSAAPCDICGYNGPGYYQPSTHKCIGEADEAKRAGALRGGK